MMPTIKDVAEKAGVGIATVSRAMNGTGYVSARSREKIEKAIRELHYIPNERARNLSRKQTGIIGVLIPDFQTPFYASFLRQVEMELYNHGYRTMVCNTVKHSDREAAYVEMLDRNMLDGLITCAWSAEAEVYRHMDKPIVSMDHNLGEGIPLIHSDHKTGGRIAAEHLLEKGCKRVLQLGDYFPVYTPSNDRYREFHRIMDEAGVEVRQLDLEWTRLDYEYYEKYGIRRYGFHGTSHMFVSGETVKLLGKDDAKVIVCHIGNGASISASIGGKCVDTSMGLTPLEGLIMGTRSGDVDPAVLQFICNHEHISVDEMLNILNKKSGLLGLSGVSSDLRDVVKAAGEENERAKLALEAYVYRIVKYIGAYAAAMNGVDAIVFTAGVGENSVPIRENVCKSLGYLGVELDKKKNENVSGDTAIISSDDSKVKVIVLPTNEELAIARETVKLV